MKYKGLKVLEHIINKNSEIINYVCIGNDKQINNDYANEIILICKKNNLNFCKRSEENQISKANYSIAISWRWILKEVDNLIILHDSLLPKYRGFAPLVSQLINGENTIGVSAILANQFYDKGDLIIQKSCNIFYPIKIKDALILNNQCYLECIDYLLNIFQTGKNIITFPQKEDQATYSLWRDDQDYLINWYDSSEKIKRFIDAVGEPYPGAKTKLNGAEILVNDTDVYSDVFIHNRDVGKVIFLENKKPVIVCAKGLLMIKEAYYKDTNKSIIPLTFFRSRFHS